MLESGLEFTDDKAFFQVRINNPVYLLQRPVQAQEAGEKMLPIGKCDAKQQGTLQGALPGARL
jgi:hypothetical protein